MSMMYNVKLANVLCLSCLCTFTAVSVGFFWKMAARGEFLPAKSEFVLGAVPNAFRWWLPTKIGWVCISTKMCSCFILKSISLTEVKSVSRKCV